MSLIFLEQQQTKKLHNDAQNMVNPQIGVRLTPEQLRVIDNLIESGDFGNRSEFVQYAVRKLLKEIGEDWRRLPPPQ